MAKSKKEKAYILYQYNEFKKDFDYIAEYYNIKELKEQEKERLKLKNDRSIYHYIKETIDDLNINLLNNKYLIIKEEL